LRSANETVSFAVRSTRSGGEFSALPKTFLHSFVRKDRRQTSFFDGLTAANAAARPAWLPRPRTSLRWFAGKAHKT
ncbi:MAG: hypothetical protein MRZ98_05975, partial [Clostridiales bacterium]|nr:hypothetical protein [Clostridiales bacterium]